MSVDLDARMKLLSSRVVSSMERRERIKVNIPPPRTPKVKPTSHTHEEVKRSRYHILDDARVGILVPLMDVRTPTLKQQEKSERKERRLHALKMREYETTCRTFYNYHRNYFDRERAGYLYIIAPESYQKIKKFNRYPCKIGYAGNAMSRLYAIQTSTWMKLTHRFVSGKLPQVSEVERECHIRYEGTHIQGEWFMLGDHDVSYIEEYIRVKQYQAILMKDFFTYARKRMGRTTLSDSSLTVMMRMIWEFHETEKRWYRLTPEQLERIVK